MTADWTLPSVPGSQVYFKKQAVFDGKNGKNTKYVGRPNLFGIAPQFKNI